MWKARVNIDGLKQKYGLDYEETYAPVATWSAMRFFLILSLLNKWHTWQLDFVLAYTQADVEHTMFMSMPKGVNIPGASGNEYTLQLEKNLYGQKQVGRV